MNVGILVGVALVVGIPVVSSGIAAIVVNQFRRKGFKMRWGE